MKPDEQKLQELTERIVDAVHPLRIILFGSAARGEMELNSDFDVLVVMPEGVHRRRTAQLIYRHLLGFGVAWEELCFQLQQCVEKSIKAVLVKNGVVFPLIHNLSKLITLMKEAGISWPDELDEAADLTVYAVETRYPGEIQPVTEEEYQPVLKIAKRVHAWAEAIIAQPHSPPTSS
jgi:HEPN domain-containing protein